MHTGQSTVGLNISTEFGLKFMTWFQRLLWPGLDLGISPSFGLYPAGGSSNLLGRQVTGGRERRRGTFPTPKHGASIQYVSSE